MSLDKPPPNRYSVKEHKGRLIVIDNWSGEKVTPAAPVSTSHTPSPLAPAPSQPVSPWATANASGPEKTVTLTTKSWFDKKAPRTVVLTASRLRQIRYAVLGAFFALLLLFAMIGDGFTFFIILTFLIIAARNSFPPAMTKWFDAAERDTIR